MLLGWLPGGEVPGGVPMVIPGMVPGMFLGREGEKRRERERFPWGQLSHQLC